MDSEFRIPGTDFRFGLDPVIGLVFPILGDIVTYVFSAFLVFYMARHGASWKLVIKMTGNVVLDLLVGGIPIAGQLGDFVIRANDRNYKLFKEFLFEGKHKGGKGLAILLLILLIVSPILVISLLSLMFMGLYRWIFA